MWEWTDVTQQKRGMCVVTATESVSKETVTFVVAEENIGSVKNKIILQDRINALDKKTKAKITLLTDIKTIDISEVVAS